MKPRGQLLGFGAVGTIGFAVDAGVLTWLAQHWGVDLYLSRVFSFCAATMTTWLLNRTVVFRVAGEVRAGREYGRYFLVQAGGALLNLCLFSLLIAAFPPLRAVPAIPLAAGSLLALMFNFHGARHWVFKPSPGDA